MSPAGDGKRPGFSLARRQVLLGGVLVGTLAIGGGALFWPRREGGGQASDELGHDWSFLRPADRQALDALAPLLIGVNPGEFGNSRQAKEHCLNVGVDQAIAFLPPRTHAELRQLFDLLASPGGRLVLLGSVTAWQDAANSALDGGLTRWGQADLALLRTAYEGLRELVFAVWYGDPANWTGNADPRWAGL